MKEEKDSVKMTEDLVDAIGNESGKQDDGLTKPERKIESSRIAEREKKAEELKKQLRKRSLGMLNYRWAAGSLMIGGIIAIITNFLPAMYRSMVVPSEVGFDTFWNGFMAWGGIYFIFPIISGVFMIILAYFAYSTPKYTFLSIIPAMMLTIAGTYVYFLVTFAVSVPGQEYLEGELYASFAPTLMIVSAVICLIAIFLRERD